MDFGRLPLETCYFKIEEDGIIPGTNLQIKILCPVDMSLAFHLTMYVISEGGLLCLRN